MRIRDELKLRIHQKITEKFPELERQKDLAKNYYILFRDEIVALAIDAFIDYSNGEDLPLPAKKKPRGPKGIYNDDHFLGQLLKMLKQGHSYSQIGRALGVSDPTICRAKNYLREKGLIEQ